MKKTVLILSLAFALLSCAESERQDRLSAVVPYPNEVKAGEGEFKAKGAGVTYDASLDEATVNIIKSFAEKLSVTSGAESAVAEGEADRGFVFLYDAEVPEEAYTLDITPEAVSVAASGLRGFNYPSRPSSSCCPCRFSVMNRLRRLRGQCRLLR